jgi:hypothetical protein
MMRTQVYIPDDLFRQAKLSAKLEGVSISEYIREGLALRLRQLSGAKPAQKKTKAPLHELVGKYGKGKKKTNIAQTHDAYL